MLRPRFSTGLPEPQHRDKPSHPFAVTPRSARATRANPIPSAAPTPKPPIICTRRYCSCTNTHSTRRHPTPTASVISRSLLKGRAPAVHPSIGDAPRVHYSALVPPLAATGVGAGCFRFTTINDAPSPPRVHYSALVPPLAA